MLTGISGRSRFAGPRRPSPIPAPEPRSGAAAIVRSSLMIVRSLRRRDSVALSRAARQRVPGQRRALTRIGTRHSREATSFAERRRVGAGGVFGEKPMNSRTAYPLGAGPALHALRHHGKDAFEISSYPESILHHVALETQRDRTLSRTAGLNPLRPAVGAGKVGFAAARSTSDHLRQAASSDPSGANRRRRASTAVRRQGHGPLSLEGDVVKDIRFQGSGCAISRRRLSMMTESMKGRTRAPGGYAVPGVSSASHRRLRAPDPAALGKLGSSRECACSRSGSSARTLPWHTLRAALDNAHGITSTE